MPPFADGMRLRRVDWWCVYRRTGGKQQVYIKISETEIADDYPEPAQYDKVQLRM